ncbi:P63C domain-containing protein [Bosea vaviloviae]|uniref:P63C domain-containing protein n=1 Tax=Bosea vaviloviae TaxID=1526658 RepID=UPI0009E7A5F5|nr:P63C domain-containing protein [Bosea vaviloviae]
MSDDSPKSKGGRARAIALSPERRREIARNSAASRWAAAAAIPKAEFGSDQSPLKIGDIELDCFVLNNSLRVISQRGMFRGLGVTRGGPREDMKPDEGGAELPRFATQNWIFKHLSSDLTMALRNPILFSAPGAPRGLGYPATILPEICDAILAARAAGDTTERQDGIVARAEELIRAFARVGIIALVDEATGYQEYRARDELQKILAAYVSPELLPWTQRFPQNFYAELHRVRGWNYAPGSNKRNHYIGKLTNELIYKQLPDGVLDELRAKNPVDFEKKRRKNLHYRYLTEEVGDPHLQKQIIAVTTLLSVSDDWTEFTRLFCKKFKPQAGDLFALPPPPSEDDA